MFRMKKTENRTSEEKMRRRLDKGDKAAVKQVFRKLEKERRVSLRSQDEGQSDIINDSL